MKIFKNNTLRKDEKCLFASSRGESLETQRQTIWKIGSRTKTSILLSVRSWQEEEDSKGEEGSLTPVVPSGIIHAFDRSELHLLAWA
jgi:hypothetical protein